MKPSAHGPILPAACSQRPTVCSPGRSVSPFARPLPPSLKELRRDTSAEPGGVRDGFTLIEVMLVIGIIAILASLLFPVVIGAAGKARQKQAMADTRNIVLAIKAYRQEYGKWPAQIQSVTDTTYVVSNYFVIQPLLGYNPKNKIFLTAQTTNLDYMTNMIDPWGIPYIICMDEDGDNQLSISNSGSYVASSTVLGATNFSIILKVANKDVGAASLGGSSNSWPYNSWTEMP